jgi:hypothetical protein
MALGMAFGFDSTGHVTKRHTPRRFAACSVGWWLMAGAGLF